MKEKDHKKLVEKDGEGMTLGRRDLMKMGVGAGVVGAAQMLDGQKASAQDTARASGQGMARPNLTTDTHVGWKNDANRASGNGPMDGTTRTIVEYVHGFSEKDLTAPVLDELNWQMVDTIAVIMAGFESEPARIGTQLARMTQSSMKSTVLGYGVITSPDIAAFTNTSMYRHTDFDINGHVGDFIPGVLAVGEALHATGAQILMAVTLGYEVDGAIRAATSGSGGGGGGWDNPFVSVATAVGVGKVMGLNEDQLANAISLALVPHMPMQVTHVGALAHWKGCHDAESVRCGVFAALAAREGMTGPSKPFEGRGGLFDHLGAFRELRLPVGTNPNNFGTEEESQGKLVVQTLVPKRTPSEGSSQAPLEMIPAIREWVKAEDIASIHIEMPFGGWQEICDPPKWDPQNRETADHSLPYIVSRVLIDGEIYLDSYTPEKRNDPVVRGLMANLTIAPNDKFTYMGQTRITVRKKSGEELVKETVVHTSTPMTRAELRAKFERVCKFRGVSNDLRDRTYATWSNLQAVKDIAEPMRDLAHFPLPSVQID